MSTMSKPTIDDDIAFYNFTNRLLFVPLAIYIGIEKESLAPFNRYNSSEVFRREMLRH